MSESAPLDEKMRTCPSCRTQISVLASKCKFCGEVVGKPKEETRSLSINDLGGENIQHRAISSSVMDALESFRIEDSKDGNDGGGIGGLDDIDMGGGDDGPKDYNRSPPQTSAAPPANTSSGINFGLIAKIAVVIAIVAVVAIKAPGFLKDTLDNEAPAKVPTVTNRAPSILEETGDPIQALEVAAAASVSNPGAENTRIADDMVVAVVKKVEDLLNADPWDKSKLRDASRLASQASQIYPHKRLTAAIDAVEQEQADYTLILLDIDSGTNTAGFKVGGRNGELKNAKQGESVTDRFKVVSISSRFSVLLEDTKRDGRILDLSVGGSLK